MDIKTKVKLSKEVESYWDLLPWHIASKIVNLKIRQEYLDEIEKERRKKLCEEIRKFYELKVRWEIGSVMCKSSCGEGCIRWYGKYVDLQGKQRRAFLAFNLDLALQRYHHVKSFIHHRASSHQGNGHMSHL